jgi:hypothetical protein
MQGVNLAKKKGVVRGPMTVCSKYIQNNIIHFADKMQNFKNVSVFFTIALMT